MTKTLSPLVVIVGETASGKSDLAMSLAQQFDGEIISADSRAIYRGMDIGTAKPSKQDQEKIKHHLIDIINPGEKYSVLRFKNDANKIIDDITNRGKLPIMVGGSGLYIDTVVFDYQFDNNPDIRSLVNPRHAQTDNKVDCINEIRDNTLIIGISRSKEELKSRIAQRFEEMLDGGVIDEVSELLNRYGSDNDVLSGIGYKTFVRYINGEIDIDRLREEYIRGDMYLAKRQRTWFKRNKSIHWIKTQSEAVELVTTLLR